MVGDRGTAHDSDGGLVAVSGGLVVAVAVVEVVVVVVAVVAVVSRTPGTIAQSARQEFVSGRNVLVRTTRSVTDEPILDSIGLAFFAWWVAAVIVGIMVTVDMKIAATMAMVAQALGITRGRHRGNEHRHRHAVAPTHVKLPHLHRVLCNKKRAARPMR
jgi:hypothetical protein